MGTMAYGYMGNGTYRPSIDNWLSDIDTRAARGWSCLPNLPLYGQNSR